MADESPKDYSRLYVERQPPLPPYPSHRIKTQTQTLKADPSIDGAFRPLKHREQNKQELRELILKLNHTPQCHVDANQALTEHYKLCFQKPKSSSNYRVVVRYPSTNNKANETFAIKVETNNLRSIKSKLPIRGNYRYFFKTNNCFEEVELDEAKVPIYNEKDGIKQIHVHLFECTK